METVENLANDLNKVQRNSLIAEQIEALVDIGDWNSTEESVRQFNDPEYKGFVNDFGTVAFGNNFYEISCLEHDRGTVIFHIDQYVPPDEFHTNEIDDSKEFKFKITPLKRDVFDFVKSKDYVRLESPAYILNNLYDFKKAIVSEMLEHNMISFDRIDGYQKLKHDGKGYLKVLKEAIAEYPQSLAHKDKLTGEEYDFLANHYVETVIKAEADYMELVKKPGWSNIHTFNPQKGNNTAINKMIRDDLKDSRIVILADKMNAELRRLGKPCINIDELKQQLASPSIKEYRAELQAAHKQTRKAR